MRLFVVNRNRLIAAILALAVTLGSGVWLVGFRTPALAVVVNGQEIAKVKNNKIYNEAMAAVQQQEEKRSGSKVSISTPIKLKKVIVRRDELVNAVALQDELKGKVGFETEAVWVIVNGKKVLAVKDKAAGRKLLDDMRATGAAVNKGEVLEWACFDQKVAFKTEKMDSKRVVNLDSAKKIMTTGSSEPVKYQVKSGDTLWNIARQYHTYVADLMKTNHLTGEKLDLDQVLLIPTSQPYLTVTAQIRGTRMEAIAYQTQITTDRKLSSRQIKVKREGQEGSKQVAYALTKKNGAVTKAWIVAEKVTKQPVDKVVAKGPRAVYSDSYQVASRGVISFLSGGWIRPLVGSITCRFGGYRGHTGMDIDGNTGDAIRAAKAGKVTFAGYSGGYGKNVVVDHGNGIKTRYAHCSKLYVKAGEKVSAGEVIAAVGSTGHSTGSHLHFEVISNGGFVNPAKILR
ncbi:MAG: peptidoglycan DD-metalloendopeptidase family protein [Methylocystaceae bacterium]